MPPNQDGPSSMHRPGLQLTGKGQPPLQPEVFPENRETHQPEWDTSLLNGHYDYQIAPYHNCSRDQDCNMSRFLQVLLHLKTSFPQQRSHTSELATLPAHLHNA